MPMDIHSQITNYKVKVAVLGSDPNTATVKSISYKLSISYVWFWLQKYRKMQ